jgi:hypothetical protein
LEAPKKNKNQFFALFSTKTTQSGAILTKRHFKMTPLGVVSKKMAPLGAIFLKRLHFESF